MAMTVDAETVWTGNVDFAKGGTITVDAAEFAGVEARNGVEYPYLVLNTKSEEKVKIIVDFLNGGDGGSVVTNDPHCSQSHGVYYYTLRPDYSKDAYAWYHLDATTLQDLKEDGLVIRGTGDFTCTSVTLQWYEPNASVASSDINFSTDSFWDHAFYPWNPEVANSAAGYRLGGNDGHFQVTQQYVSLNFKGDPRVKGTPTDRYISLKKGDVIRVYCPDRLPDLYMLKEVEILTRSGCYLKLVYPEGERFDVNGNLGHWRAGQDRYTEDIWFEATADVEIVDIKYTTMAASRSYTFDVCKVSAAKKATFCPTYDVIVPEGITAYKATSVYKKNNVAYVVFTEIESVNGVKVIPNGEGVYLEAEPGDYVFTWRSGGEQKLERWEDNLLVGNNDPEFAPEDGEIYILSSGGNGVGFYRNYQGGNLRRGVAYLPCSVFNETVDGDGNKTVHDHLDAPGYAGVMVDDDDATMIWDAVFETENEVRTATGIFTIDGQRVDNMNKPGLYIVNGKKYLKVGSNNSHRKF